MLLMLLQIVYKPPIQNPVWKYGRVTVTWWLGDDELPLICICVGLILNARRVLRIAYWSH